MPDSNRLRKALPADKQQVINLLRDAFMNNRSVNWIVKQDKHKKVRIEGLMQYAFRESSLSDGAFVSADGAGALLFTLPYANNKGLAGLLADIRLAFTVVGLSGLPKVLRREKYIKKKHPRRNFIYLWFIGVSPEKQGKGLGSQMLSELVFMADEKCLPIYLETSTPDNLPFYQKHGFHSYHEWKDEQAGFTLWFMKREATAPQ